MATKYELPEEVNNNRLRTLGTEVEMKTFKTNVASDGETSNGERFIAKIICVGGVMGLHRKGMFINDYFQNYRPEKDYWRPLTGVDLYLKIIRRQKIESEEPLLITLEFLEMPEHEKNFETLGTKLNFANMTKVYCKGGHGAIAFWGTRNPSSLEQAKRWKQLIRMYLNLPSIPCVLVTDNTAKPDQEPLQWIGPGKIFESEAALDQFCKDHGFVDHFEIKSRDWESGEKSVFGQAVNCLLDEIFRNESNKKEMCVIG